MSWKSKPSWYNRGDARGEAPLQTSEEFVRTYGAVVDALTATIINAEAGLNRLSVQQPDLEEVRRTLKTIANDARLAGEIVVRIRAPMRDDAPIMSTRPN